MKGLSLKEDFIVHIRMGKFSIPLFFIHDPGMQKYGFFNNQNSLLWSWQFIFDIVFDHTPPGFWHFKKIGYK